MKLSLYLRPVLLGSLFVLAAGCGTAGTDGTGTSVASATVAESGREGRGGPARFFARLDRDGDGRVALAEIPAPMQQRLAGADADRDGALTREELAAHAQAQRAARFAQMDQNHDGALTQDEVGERWNRMVRADANGDGRVSSDELAQHFASRPHGGGMGRHGHMGPPEGMGPEGAVGPRGAMGGRGFDPARMLARFDANGDGRVEVSELPERMQARVGAADANHDGVLAADEMTAFAAARRAERMQRAPGAPAAPTAPADLPQQ